ncbi:MAG TPA: hypothetical protein VGE98_10810 [Thermoanaerobaculia bacterium]
MKKYSPNALKLALSRETLHDLANAELQPAVGGKPTPPTGPTPSQCYTECVPTTFPI